MAEKILNTRIQLKYDSYENWSKIDVEGQGANLVLKEGEVGICYIPEKTEVNGIKNPPHVMMKIGDGVTPFASLKWLSARAADVEDWAKAETKPVYSAQEITGIGEYIAKYVDEELGISVDTNTVYQIVKVDDNHYKLQSKAAGTDAWADVADSVITIPESTKVEASTTNGNIKVDGEEVKVYDDVFETDILTVNALGGIAAGADLNGMSTHEILNTLLFPYVAFTLGSTSRTAAAATLENGATQTLNSASISITKKSKPITSVKLLNGSTVLGEKIGDEVAAGGTITFSNLAQCIYAGSCKMNYTKTFGWYFISLDERSPSWTGVEYFYNFMTTNAGVGPFGREVGADEVEIGDAVQLAKEDGDFYHTLLVVGFDGEEILVAAQTNDAYGKPLSEYEYSIARFIKIDGVRFEAMPSDDCFLSVYDGVAIIAGK